MNLEPAEVETILSQAEKTWESWMPLLKLEYPLGKEIQAEQTRRNGGRVEGIVGISFADFDDEESFLSALSEALVGSDSLSDVRYKPVFADGNKVYYEVSGEPF